MECQHLKTRVYINWKFWNRSVKHLTQKPPFTTRTLCKTLFVLPTLSSIISERPPWPTFRISLTISNTCRRPRSNNIQEQQLIARRPHSSFIHSATIFFPISIVCKCYFRVALYMVSVVIVCVDDDDAGGEYDAGDVVAAATTTTFSERGRVVGLGTSETVLCAYVQHGGGES